MSGRKASEVSGLLQQCKKARGINEANWYNKTGYNLEKADRNQEEINKVYDSVKNNPIYLDKQSETDEDLVFIVKRLKDMTAKIKRDTYTAKINTLKNRWKDLMKELSHIDDEAESIRNIIANKPHYCDAEYNRAGALVAEYQRITRQILKIVEETNHLEEASTSGYCYAAQISEYLQQLEGYRRDVQSDPQKDLEEAKEASEEAYNRNTLAKEFIGQVNEVGLDVVLEFVPEEYEAIKSKIEQLMEAKTATNQELEKSKEEIGEFFLALRLKQEEWKEKKEEMERSYLRVQKLAMEDTYYDPLDYAENDKYAEKIHLFEFLANYQAAEYEENYKAAMEEAEFLLSAGDFAGVKNCITKAAEAVKQASEKAALWQENMVKNIYLAKDMQEAMESLSYEVEISCIDGNVKNGIKVTCRSGEEEIDFDKVLIEEEGSIVMDINHTESSKGTCGATWREIAAVMREYNIPMTDVRKDGHSLLYAPKEKVRLDRREAKGRLRV